MGERLRRMRLSTIRHHQKQVRAMRRLTAKTLRYGQHSVLFLLITFLCACAGVKPLTLTAEQPRQETFRSSDAMVTSTVMVPFEITCSEITRLLEQSLRKEIYRGATATKGLSVTITRNGAVAITAADNYLYISLPVSLSLSYSMFESKALPLTLKFKAAAGITPYWRLHAEIYYLGLSDLLAEEVGIGPFTFKPRSIVDGLTQPVQKMLTGLVVQKINDLLPLKARVATAWQTMQQPLPLDDSRTIWLQLMPREIMMYPLTAHHNRIRASLGVTAGASVVIGAQPPPHAATPLPTIRQVASFDPSFRLTMNGAIPYRELRTVAAPLLLEKTFDVDGKQVTIKEFDLYGNGDNIIVKLVTAGALDGVLYLTAQPYFDAAANSLAVRNVDFDLHTQDLLLASADWFLHSSIRSTLQEKLNMKLTAQLAHIRQKAEQALAKVPLTDTLALKGKLTSLTFQDLVVQQSSIVIQMQAVGETSLMFY